MRRRERVGTARSPSNRRPPRQRARGQAPAVPPLFCRRSGPLHSPRPARRRHFCRRNGPARRPGLAGSRTGSPLDPEAPGRPSAPPTREPLSRRAPVSSGGAAAPTPPHPRLLRRPSRLPAARRPAMGCGRFMRNVTGRLGGCQAQAPSAAPAQLAAAAPGVLSPAPSCRSPRRPLTCAGLGRWLGPVAFGYPGREPSGANGILLPVSQGGLAHGRRPAQEGSGCRQRNGREQATNTSGNGTNTLANGDDGPSHGKGQ